MLSPALGADSTREPKLVGVGWEVPAACSSANVPGDMSSDDRALLQGSAPQGSAWSAARAGHRYCTFPVQGGEQPGRQPRQSTMQHELVQEAKQDKWHAPETPYLAMHTGKCFSRERCGWAAHPSSEPLTLEDPSCDPRPHREPSSRPIEPDIGAECVQGPSDPDSA